MWKDEQRNIVLMGVIEFNAGFGEEFSISRKEYRVYEDWGLHKKVRKNEVVHHNQQH
ncbi:hypothetical protein [Granulicatella balaenopterae]|uniref:hypothetical protein n=1 Tax=Granulicatella balaenopterae TaxID=137733 RepID=UPI0015A678CA|nr:hypothetical protein [Granulicatella balaenopterae]